MSDDPTSHVTTRRLTKAWEYGQRKLYGYSFAEDRFFERSSRSLLTAEESFGTDVERFLNVHIENPLSNYLDAVAEGTLVQNHPWVQERALILSMLFQSMRVGAGRGDVEATQKLKELLTKDASFLDQLAIGSRTMFRFVGAKIGHGQHLFFPADGVAALPMIGAPAKTPGMMFQPTTMKTFFAGIPSNVPEGVAEEQLHTAMANGTIVAFSVGLICDRVIIPPPIRGRDESDIKRGLLELRAAARGFVQVIAKANRVVGLS
jgi:hypothetical protein